MLWHGLGTEVQEAPTSTAALVYAGLDWQKDVCTKDGLLIPGYKASMRSTDNATLGIVSEKYKVVQNADAFKFTDDLLGEGVTYETAGALQGGNGIEGLLLGKAKGRERKIERKMSAEQESELFEPFAKKRTEKREKKQRRKILKIKRQRRCCWLQSDRERVSQGQKEAAGSREL